MAKHYLGIILLFLVGAVGAQTTNQWINYNQPYYRINIVSTGVYRVTAAQLEQAGIDIQNVSPDRFQLFRNGKQVRMWIGNRTAPDSVLNGDDFLEFFGTGNNGFMDSLVYDVPSNILNPYTSLFNDTAAYFLTHSSTEIGLRYQAQPDTGYSNRTAFPYFFKATTKNYRGDYGLGIQNSAGSYSPVFGLGEGYSTGYAYNLTAFGSPNMSTPFPFSNGPPMRLSMKIASNNGDPQVNGDHRVKFFLNNASGLLLADDSWDGPAQRFYNVQISATAVADPFTFLLFQPQPSPGTNPKRYAFAYIMGQYAHLPNMEGLKALAFFAPKDSLSDATFMQWSNLGSSSDSAWVYDFDLGLRIKAQRQGSALRILLPHGTMRRNCFAFFDDATLPSPPLKPVTVSGYFTDFFQTQSNASYLIVSAPALLSSANAYGAYRSSTGEQVVVANIDELYDQYAFGIRKNPLAIREFARDGILTLPNPPKHLFLIGKGILNLLSRNDTVLSALNQVPTWGYYGSDTYITATLPGGSDVAPSVPIGRLSATTNQQVLDYLAKVQAFESQPKAMWMKEVLHFAGGFSAGEQEQHLLYLNEYKRILEDTLFGGRVSTYKKSTTAPVELAAADSIRQRIEGGVCMMNFFGHAAGSSFDVSPLPPNEYNNIGKYPLIMANSCYVGDLFQPPWATYQFTSEKYVLIPNKGSIAFLAQSSPGVGPPGYYYSKAFLTHLGQTDYGASIGTCIKKGILDIQNPQDPVLTETCLTMTLHGDPAIRMNPFDKPDYRLQASDVRFIPSVITTDLDTFRVRIRYQNMGRAEQRNLVHQIRRFLPDSLQATTYIVNQPAPYLEDSFEVKLPVNLLHGPGQNRLDVSLDALNGVEETNESNNVVSILFTIQSDELYPVFPYKFGVVGTPNTQLVASTSDAFAASRTYLFQIDTLPSFNSPFLQVHSEVTTGGVVRWTLPFNLSDSMVYFWRVSPDSLPGGQYRWKASSFQHLNGKNGWAQANFKQITQNKFSLLQTLPAQQIVTFPQLQKELTIITYSAPGSSIPSNAQLFATEYRIDNELIESAGISYNPAFHVAVMDSLTLEPWEIRYNSGGVLLNPNNGFGNANDYNPINGHTRYFVFQQSSASQMAGLKNMLLNGIPNGAYIGIYSWIRCNFQNLADTSLRSVLEQLGADSVRYLPSNRAWAFFVRKGYPNTAIERFSPADGSYQVVLNAPMQTQSWQGAMWTDPIGPSMRWDSLIWRARKMEIAPGDSLRVEVRGLASDGSQPVLLTSGLLRNGLDLSSISASTYRYIQLRFTTRDSIYLTPTQLKRWHVLYQPAPEAALNPQLANEFHAPVVQQGESVSWKIGMENVSEVSMDSLLVNFWLQQSNGSRISLPFARLDSLRVGSSLEPRIQVNTENLSGDYQLWVEINPFHSALNRYDQPEQYRFNNLAHVNFRVDRDKVNPLLDVTFDGNHILDGDIISPKPSILMVLRDENKFLALNDTSDFTVWMKWPNESSSRRVYFQTAQGPQLQFTPASLPNNKCSITYLPYLTKDGVYELSVQARDASGNASATQAYRIRFEVVNRSTITQLMNYPNPFTTSTRFVFTLTGSVLPEKMTIQILSVSGKVVREITESDLGPIRIGRNITTYAWDGTDEYGDRLGNGVYFYRVVTTLNGEEMERRESGADAYFHKGFGKIFLMR